MRRTMPVADSFGGRGQRLRTAVHAFDESVDDLLEPVRANAIASQVMQAATNAAEFSAVWHVSNIVRGLAKGRPDQIVALTIGIAAESVLVNQGIKRLFRRARPTAGGDERFDIRAPITSSFPSGHASAAAFAATVLIGWDGKRSIPLWGTLATTVVLSRPFVRIHHASDVVAGVAVGAALGALFRSVHS